MSANTRQLRIPTDANRILFVRNLPLKASADDLYEIFGKHGPIRQIRRGSVAKTRGTAFVVYEDLLSAKKAVESLNGFHVGGRYLVCLYYQPERHMQKITAESQPATQTDNK